MTDRCSFLTEVEVTGAQAIGHGVPVWTVGSCFADEIGSRMARDMMRVAVNPLGTLYNPLSIADALGRVTSGRRYGRDDLFLNEGRWHSPDFHSSFSGFTPEDTLARINSTMERLQAEAPETGWLMITLGSARVFVDNASGLTVANCHKLPASRFTVRDVSADEAVEALFAALLPMMELAPELKVMLTVSPIRHKAYGFHADRLSKATLLLAADSLIKALPPGRAFYFPAYEIMQDELRDYRFYAADMIHPSEVAADHIYRRFAEAWLTPRALACAARCRKLQARLAHRHSPGEPEELRRRFEEGTLRLAEEIKAAFPEAASAIDCATGR